ncbi:unnamed protein product [Parascedosporium putredinis]|uniref:Fatty acid hydroxylase domain-containing protein n=1 Tax=Parascedosporium putredinis TaxID=1442378 RepID=A0A9P1H9T4_9PEZI|nr:unnamed protein product [Parascedosporium putredinis]CAI8003912.1 unnamed protein product [Parascedosporium putredinis]
MDVLLSIPLLSTLLTPSWSTSMNLLFFYATWSTLVLAYDPTKIHASALLALRVILWLAPSLLFLTFDSLLPSLASEIKFPGTRLAPRRPLRLLGIAVGNMLLATGVEAALSYGFHQATGDTIFRTSTTLPLPWQLFKHIATLLAAREVLTYYIHRFVLHGKKSATLTRLHGQWCHAHPMSSLQLYLDHPLPLLVHRLIPIMLPALAVRPHLLTYMLFTMICTLEGTLTNSGYSIVPGIILGGMARRTAVHYATKGDANYSPLGVLDWAHGTSRGGDVLADIKDEAEKHDVKRRSARKVNKGARAVQNSKWLNDDE